MMWGKLSKRWQIISATLFSVLLIAGAYILAKGNSVFEIAQASTETALLQAIATKDSDSDGLPDWEEVLYGTDPQNPDSFHLGMSDGEAVTKGLIVPKATTDIPTTNAAASTTVDYAASGLPDPSTGTITDGFAKTFFTLYVAAKNANDGNDLSSDQVNELATQAINQLSNTITPAPDFKTTKDLKISGTGTDALKTFAASAEAVLTQNATTSSKTDLEYLQEVIQNNDKGAVAALGALAKQYRDSAVGLSVLPVPEEIADQNAQIINSLMRLGQIYGDFSRFGQDPLTAMFALNQYKDTELGAEQAFTALASIYAREGVVLPPGTPGSAFVNLMSNLSARQSLQTQ